MAKFVSSEEPNYSMCVKHYKLKPDGAVNAVGGGQCKYTGCTKRSINDLIKRGEMKLKDIPW